MIFILFSLPCVGRSHSLFLTIHMGWTFFSAAVKKKKKSNGKSVCNQICAQMKSARDVICSDGDVWGLWSSAPELHVLLSWEVWHVRARINFVPAILRKQTHLSVLVEDLKALTFWAMTLLNQVISSAHDSNCESSKMIYLSIVIRRMVLFQLEKEHQRTLMRYSWDFTVSKSWVFEHL